MKNQDILEELDNIELPIEKLESILFEFQNNIDVVNAIASNIIKKDIMYDYQKSEIQLLREFLVKLTYIDNVNIQIAIAKNSYTPNYILKKLSTNSLDLIRATISTNEYASSYILNKLSKDKVKIVRDALAGNSAAPMKILDKLSKSKDKMTRMRVAENPSTSKNILKKLINDIDGDVVNASIKMFN